MPSSESLGKMITASLLDSPEGLKAVSILLLKEIEDVKDRLADVEDPSVRVAMVDRVSRIEATQNAILLRLDREEKVLTIVLRFMAENKGFIVLLLFVLGLVGWAFGAFDFVVSAIDAYRTP